MHRSIRVGISALPVVPLLLVPATPALPSWAPDGLTAAQHQEMRQGLRSAQNQSWRVQSRQALGQTVPDSIALKAFPNTVADELPALKRYEFFVTDADIFVVDPSTRKVVDAVVR